jgi:hypothetical protein
MMRGLVGDRIGQFVVDREHGTSNAGPRTGTLNTNMEPETRNKEQVPFVVAA